MGARLFAMSKFRAIGSITRGMGLRYTALLLLTIMWLSIVVPSVSALGALYEQAHFSQAPSQDSQKMQGKDKAKAHLNQLDPNKANKKMAQNYPSGMKPTVAKGEAAADATPTLGTKSTLLAQLGKQGTGQSQSPSARPVDTPKKTTPHELTEKRTATTSVSVNADGSMTERNYMTPHFYKKSDGWATINTKLSEDKNAGDSGNVAGKAWGNVESWFSKTNTYTVTDNDWQARFAPSDFGNGMLRVKKGNSQIGFSPVGANKVDPVITTNKDGQQTVHYYNLWKGVDVEYVVESAAVKENVIIKNKQSANQVSFKVLGANLEKQTSGPNAGAYAIKGALNNDFAVAPANLILNQFGMVTESGVFDQTYSGDKITLAVKKDYLQNLPDKAFPAVIDPGVFTSTFGNRGGGNYVSFKSDGYICYSNVCNLYAGSLYDSSYNLRWWRGAYFAPYDQFRNSATPLLNATLHLTQRSNESFWTGDWGAHTFQVGHATCLNSFNCVDGYWTSGTVAGAGDINVTNIYQAMISGGDFGAWLMVMSEDGTDHSFKNLDPNNSYVVFTYGGQPSAPSFASPSIDGQVFVDPQPSFRVNPVSNPNSSTPLQYEIMVSSAPGGAGTVISSGLQNSAQWTVPDGILQDGSTYYVQARSYDPGTGTSSSWGASVSFRIDMRTGKDKTQTFDTLGPVSVDLATGNVATNTSSHTSSALGGSLGISLDYNSPLRSRNGLVGEYWNVPANSQPGAPTSPALVTRVDQNVDFNWDLGSPSAGTINNDWFYGRWTGYFVAPATGTYSFGGNNDDWLSVWINGNVAYANGGCYSGVCYGGGTDVTLQAGQVVPIRVEYMEATSPAYAHLYVKGPVSQQVVPQAWLQTGVRPVSQQNGLTGYYYTDDGTHNLNSATKSLFMQRTDSLLNFNWGTGAPVVGAPSDSFMVRWSGSFTAPAAGTYYFGTQADDGSRVTVNGTTALDSWSQLNTNRTFGTTGVTLAQNQSVPISVDYYEVSGPAYLGLYVRGAVAEQLVPSQWLSPKAQVLPDGWNLGIDPDGNISYDHIKINPNSVVLTDSTGSTHEYTWTGNGYKPPVNEDGQLTRNSDGTFTFIDTDGRTYVFAADGTLTSVTTPVDDRHPAAVQYEYQSLNGSPAHLWHIKDGVDPTRATTVYYSGQTECGTAPATFDSAAPNGMICALGTNDGRFTYFYYLSGQLARIQQPGNDVTDYRYEQVQNGGVTIGYRIQSIRDSLANDAIAAGSRADDSTTNTELAYDILGRVTSVTQPAAMTGETRTQHTIEYLPGKEAYTDTNGVAVPGYYGATQQHVASATEPNGFTHRVEYDSLFRTTKDTDIANLSDTTQWDAAKDLTYSTTDEAGLRTTTIYDDEDRSVGTYGPAPVAWFDTSNPKNQIPLSTYTNQVPHTSTAYDQGMVGPAVAWYDYYKADPNVLPGGSLMGAPRYHTTGLTTSAPATMSVDLVNNAPITTKAGMSGIGFTATGKLRLPNGTYWINADTSEGIRVWVDDQLVLDSWQDAAYRSITGGSFTVAGNAVKRLRISAYRKYGSTGAFNVWMKQDNGFNWTTDWSAWLKPDYSLTTASTVYDNTLGNGVTTTNYGSQPELGLAQSTTVDPTGLNLTTSSTYEQQGATGSFLRQTAKYLPGANTADASTATQYTYYGATETRDNPCTTTVEAYKQGGQLKLKTEPDPDGNGPQTGRISETVYDDAGRIVATRYNSDSWTCTTYDSRGRVTQTTVPAFNGEAARTITNNYAYNGDPLTTTTGDGNGNIQTTVDLLGRTRSYMDAYNNWTGYEYTPTGELSRKYGDMGEEIYLYDNYHRLVNQQFNGTTYATITYDSFGRVDHTDYNNAGQMRQTVGRDSLGRVTSLTYQMGDGTTTVSDTVTRSQGNQTTTDVVQSGTNQLWYSYGYDTAGRLTSANIGPHTYAYGYGAADASCNAVPGNNVNAGKNGNRTSQTIDGVATTHCYNYADQLISSSNQTSSYNEYDSHGNMTYFGVGAEQLRLCFDSSDRNSCLVQRDDNGDHGTAIYYSRDAQGRILYRETDAIDHWNWNLLGYTFNSYTGPGDTPDFIRDSNWNIVQQTLELPGGVLLNVKPQQTGNTAKQYSLPNIHTDVLLTADAAGTNTSNGNGPASSFTYDPFGNIIQGSSAPANNAFGSYGYVGQHEKLTESDLALTPIQMGVRVYLPTVGRFASVDPIEGGTSNSYVYATDPVNDFDLTGQSLWGDVGKWVWNHKVDIALTALTFVPVVGEAAWAARACVVVAKAARVIGGAEKAATAVRATVTAVRATRVGSILTRGGAEIKIGARLRISPFGQAGAVGKGGQGANWAARLPHFHFKPVGASSKIMKLHRPWETVFKRWFRR